MLNIQDKDIFVKAISAKHTNLSERMIDAVSFILSIIESESSYNLKLNRSFIYASNISDYVKSSFSKYYTSYELIVAALGDKMTNTNRVLINSLLNIKHSLNDKTEVKINKTKKQLIKI